jgi:transposase-like protein
VENNRYTAKVKAEVALNAVQGRNISELVSEYGISETLVCQWRDEFLANAANAFVAQDSEKKIAQLKRKAAEVQQELTFAKQAMKKLGIK